MTLVVVGLMAWVIVTVARIRARSRAVRSVTSRLSLGADGIVVGAAPIEHHADTGRAVLLLHGFGDTPQSVRYLASYLHAHGWAVRGPLLPGHGRSLEAFAASRADDWIDCARQELNALRTRYPSVSIVGQSMGGSLATILAGEAEASDVRALVLLAPYLSMPTRLRRAAAAHSILGMMAPYLRGGGERSIRDPAEAARNLAYGFTTPRLVYELARVVDLARRAASSVTTSTLVVQSRQDHRIPADAAERAFALFTAPERRLIWTEGNGHIISVDYGREAVFSSVVEWLAAHAVAPAQPLTRPDRLPTPTRSSP